MIWVFTDDGGYIVPAELAPAAIVAMMRAVGVAPAQPIQVRPSSWVSRSGRWRGRTATNRRMRRVPYDSPKFEHYQLDLMRRFAEWRRRSGHEDVGDEWLCDGDCGCGTCVPHGRAPIEPFHLVADGAGGQRVCGRFVYFGPCAACVRDVARECAT
jgi:hypothetical protein